MKLLSFLFTTTLTTTLFAQSEIVDTKPHKIVMQYTQGDSLDQVAVVGQVSNVLAALPNAKIEVICHSSGLDLLVTSKSFVSPIINDLAKRGVVFAACNNSMKKRKVSKDQLLPVAIVVPSAMVELVLKQEKGWSYVKGAH